MLQSFFSLYLELVLSSLNCFCFSQKSPTCSLAGRRG
uniref:Uncharacterized protein n=1 Tax=Arundo donax TaxID=35708 RepID=A0A0A8YP42_ARUDO